MSWLEDAACRGRTAWFYPEPRPGPNGTDYSAALTLCARCPVSDECLDDALATGDIHGVRGGYTPDELARVSAPAGFRARTCERCEAVYMASPHAANRKYCDGCGPVALAEAKRRFDDRRYGRVAS